MEAPNLASEIHKSVKKRMEEKGLLSFDEYEQMVDDVIDEMIDNSRMTEEEDTKSLRENLQSRFRSDESVGEDANENGNG
ncbi:hypothetical protein ACFL0L_01945 [Patescibacteria group bacterium]